MYPECFSTFGNIGFKKQIKTLIQSLSYFHPNSELIIFTDTQLKEEIEKFIIEKSINLKIEIVVKLDKFSNKNRQMMEKEGIFKEFTIIKADLIEYALDKFSNTLFLDGDLLIVNPLTIPEDYEKFDIGLSPHFIKPNYIKKVGFYNSGFIFVKNRDFIKYWKYQTQKSRYFEQASLEPCAKRFNTFLFGENYNVAWWKIELGLKGKEVGYRLFSVDNENIYYNKNPIIFIHSHFNGKCRFNDTIIKLLENCDKKRFLLDFLN